MWFSVSRQLSPLESVVSPFFAEVVKLMDLHGEMAFLKPGEFGSAVVEELPEMFTDFRESRFVLPWRGTRDGVSSKV
jgi:hypothetical protein